MQTTLPGFSMGRRTPGLCSNHSSSNSTKTLGRGHPHTVNDQSLSGPNRYPPKLRQLLLYLAQRDDQLIPFLLGQFANIWLLNTCSIAAIFSSKRLRLWVRKTRFARRSTGSGRRSTQPPASRRSSGNRGWPCRYRAIPATASASCHRAGKGTPEPTTAETRHAQGFIK